MWKELLPYKLITICIKVYKNFNVNLRLCWYKRQVLKQPNLIIYSSSNFYIHRYASASKNLYNFYLLQKYMKLSHCALYCQACCWNCEANKRLWVHMWLSYADRRSFERVFTVICTYLRTFSTTGNSCKLYTDDFTFASGALSPHLPVLPLPFASIHTCFPTTLAHMHMLAQHTHTLYIYTSIFDTL